MLGSYPSLNLHDPETYIASTVSLFCCYPQWAVERAIPQAMLDAKYVPPTQGILRPLLEDEMRVPRYAAQWERAADEQVKRLEAPRALRPSYAELRDRHGENWGIKADHESKRPQTGEEARASLISQVGQDAFDAIPDHGHALKSWKKLQSGDDDA